MRRISVSAFVLLVFLILLTPGVATQELSRRAPDETCEGPVYKGSEVSRRAAFISRPTPELTDEARANLVRGSVILSAVLCRTGKVTDIQVLKGVPFGVSERAIEATRQVRFTPAERDGQAVSQAIKFEFNFRYLGERRPLAREPLAGRAVEFIEIEGYREELRDKIWSGIKTRGGQPYKKEQIEHDWQTLLELGDFDKEASTLRIEEGDRGGVGVIFQLRGRPNR